MEYTWNQQKSFNEDNVLSFLPLKMRTDLALQIHYRTLSKVKLFQDCDHGLLKELVVKLRPIIYLPGDYICRKDDIGREMYIVQSGFVHVLGGKDGKSCLVTLAEGSVFGEIALLGVTGMNRRTADVVSQGFSNLFTLRKEDLEETLKHYPDAKRILNSKARKLMKENEERSAKEGMKEQGEVIFTGESNKKDPALLNMVMKMLPSHSMTQLYLKHGSRVGSVSLQGGDYSGGNQSRMSRLEMLQDQNSFSGSRNSNRHSFQSDMSHDEGRILSRRSSLATTVFDKMYAGIPELRFSVDDDTTARNWTGIKSSQMSSVIAIEISYFIL